MATYCSRQGLRPRPWIICIQALGELGGLARLPSGDVDLPVFDAQRIADELSVFPEWFLQKHLGLSQADLPSAIWQELLALLISVFREQSQCVVHRDFHSRNIMCLADGRLGIIDFQDAVLGPVTYDPVSLLKDCYVRWPRDDQLRWLDLTVSNWRHGGRHLR